MLKIISLTPLVSVTENETLITGFVLNISPCAGDMTLISGGSLSASPGFDMFISFLFPALSDAVITIGSLFVTALKLTFSPAVNVTETKFTTIDFTFVPVPSTVPETLN